MKYDQSIPELKLNGNQARLHVSCDDVHERYERKFSAFGLLFLFSVSTILLGAMSYYMYLFYENLRTVCNTLMGLPLIGGYFDHDLFHYLPYLPWVILGMFFLAYCFFIWAIFKKEYAGFDPLWAFSLRADLLPFKKRKPTVQIYKWKNDAAFPNHGYHEAIKVANPKFDRRTVEHRNCKLFEGEIHIYSGEARFYDKKMLRKAHFNTNKIPTWKKSRPVLVCPATINYLLNNFGMDEVERMASSGRMLLKRLGTFNIPADDWNRVMDNSVTIACAIRRSRDSTLGLNQFFRQSS